MDVPTLELAPVLARGKHQQIPVHDAGGGGVQIFVLIKFFSGLVTCAKVGKFGRNITQTSLQATNSTM